MMFEKYLNYKDIKNTSPDDQAKDALNIIKKILPTFDEKWIDNIEDQSSDKGIKFQVELSGGDTIHMYKTSKWISNESSWDFFINKKKIKPSDLRNSLELKYLSDLDAFLKYAFSYNFESEYINNGKQHKAAVDNNTKILQSFNDLNSSDKKEAIKQLKSKFDANDVDSLFK